MDLRREQIVVDKSPMNLLIAIRMVPDRCQP